ncbi:hypothetical protein K458DRAFT_294639 [Lentithecium fluviatile CBS 122367]|uniref:RED-like N-terminal domain-containing protein n=1 Tax=Lentithecium fluviatile CBS 122367 TaxID=1168545 RepID=A0A6G1JC06_9PLEO|nr:hypothetical protein K458DRAFT_294639 [Lentithecium fluviatile CBS 122367]
MNNDQFRRLLIDTPKQQNKHASAGKTPASRTPSTVLGARKHSSIPMTPRQVGRSTVQSDFARQLAERNAKANPQKKFRSAVPKGTKLAAGYTDRSKDRQDDEEDEKAKRIKNLEALMKLGQIDRETFEKTVQEVTDGDIKVTHLVKGLDRKLLDRVRKGEDVLGGKAKEEEKAEEPGVDDEFDELEGQEVGPIMREKAEKKGEMVPPPPVAGVKRSRNDILAELKRRREEEAAAAAAEHEKKYPSLGASFRKVNQRGETSRIETDAKGREVLIITDAQGKEKRKVRKQRVEEPPTDIRHDLDDPEKPINMHNLPPPKEESEDEDIFEGVGSSYNPLADLDGGESSDEDEGEVTASDAAKVLPSTDDGKPELEKRAPSESGDDSTGHEDQASHHPPKLSTSTKPPHRKRDYFKSSHFSTPKAQDSESSNADATVRAALQKVRTLDPNSTLINDPNSEEVRLKKRAAELAARDRDMEDIDMGFGESRFDDADEMEKEGEKVKFSEWKGIGAEEDDDGAQGRGAKKRKRGPKKKKGDKNSVNDVLNAMERQKEKTLG